MYLKRDKLNLKKYKKGRMKDEVEKMPKETIDVSSCFDDVINEYNEC